jgi:hypothetical protein
MVQLPHSYLDGKSTVYNSGYVCSIIYSSGLSCDSGHSQSLTREPPPHIYVQIAQYLEDTCKTKVKDKYPSVQLFTVLDLGNKQISSIIYNSGQGNRQMAPHQFNYLQFWTWVSVQLFTIQGNR